MRRVVTDELRLELKQRFSVEVSDGLLDLVYQNVAYLGETIELSDGGGHVRTFSVFLLPGEARPAGAIWSEEDDPPWSPVAMFAVPQKLRDATDFVARWWALDKALETFGRQRVPSTVRVFVGPVGCSDLGLIYHSDIDLTGEWPMVLWDLGCSGSFRVMAHAFDAYGSWPFWDSSKGGRL